MEIVYKGESVVVDMPGWYCDASGESIHDGSDMKVSDRALNALKAKVEVRLDPQAMIGTEAPANGECRRTTANPPVQRKAHLPSTLHSPSVET